MNNCGCKSNKGCNTCSTPRTSLPICEIHPGDDLDVRTISEISGCCKIVRISSLIDIVSPDDSIGIEKDGSTYILKANYTDNDRFVGINSSDTPGYLQGKLISTCNNILTITPIQLSQDNWALNFCVDPSKIPNVDEKVAVAAGCQPKYLFESLGTIGEYFEFVRAGCNVVFRAQEQVRFLAHVYTQDMYISGELPERVDGYGFIPSSYWRAQTTMASQIYTMSFSGTIPGGGSNTSGIIIPKSGFYGVSFGGSGKTSQGITTIRNQVIVFRDGTEAIRIFDERFSGIRAIDMNDNGILDPEEYNYPYSDIWEVSAPPGEAVVDSSLGTSLRGYGFGSYRLIYLEEGDFLTFIYKVSTQGDNLQYPVGARVGYSSNSDDPLTNGRGAGVWLSVQEELEYKIND